jgi:hypothetical protein
MTTRHAACSCGQLSLTAEGEPVRVSICHCRACQRRTGSVFGVQARFPRDQVHDIQGRRSTYARAGDSGNKATFSFCPDCGATLFWEPETMPDFISIGVGCFADPDFPVPYVSVYENRMHPWVMHAGALDLEHD